MGNTRSNGGKADFKLTWARRAGPFLCLFTVAYGLLMALWPVWGGAYARLYATGAAFLFESFGSRAIVAFSRPDDTHRDEVKITFYDRQRVDAHARPVPLLRIAHDVRYGVYIYVAFLTALVLATPIPWRRRGWALFGGLILIHAFMAFRLLLLVVQLLNSNEVALLPLPWFWGKVLLLSVQVFTINILPSFVVAIFIWILVSFRRANWPGIVLRQSPAGTTSHRTCPGGR
jgi:hypothetical protein